jgi:hypothetical protein
MLQFHGPFSSSRAAVIEVNLIIPDDVAFLSLTVSAFHFCLLADIARKRTRYATSKLGMSRYRIFSSGRYGIQGATESPVLRRIATPWGG